MNTFDDLFDSAKKNEQNNRPFDKDAWAERKQAERKSVYDLADQTAEMVSADGGRFRDYLDIQTRFDRYSATNALLILAQMPQATQLKDFDGWREAGASIKKQQKGISILEPGEEYKREDGSMGTSYNVKKVFDISQTTARAKVQPAVSMDDRLLLKALIHIDNIHTVLHQVLDMAVDDDYIRVNPSNSVLKELKQSHIFKTEKRRGLTKPEQELMLDFLKKSRAHSRWYPIFAVMVGTGLRVGELTGLRWCDIDLDNGVIDVNHTLVYYCHREESSKNGCYFNINTPKTVAGNRQVPMLDFVKEAFLMEKEYQQLAGIHCEVTVDGYSDFIFLNRNGSVYNQSTLNKAIRRIIRDCNDAEFLKDESPTVLLPHFSCHSLRHTFTTRMCEAGVNVKVIQDTLGHQDISTTMNIYADATKDFKMEAFAGLNEFFQRI